MVLKNQKEGILKKKNKKQKTNELEKKIFNTDKSRC